MLQLANKDITCYDSLVSFFIKFIKIHFTNLESLYIGTLPRYFYNLVYCFKYISTISMNICIDISVYDNPGKQNRFTLIYHFLSTIFNQRFCFYFQANELTNVYSLSSLFCSATWNERECWDLFGVFFIANSDLRRILTDYGFKGHPLRKDFPLTGFYELNYSDLQQQIMLINVELTQEFRNFTFNIKW
jgi:NADH:ubiquinone oxidoreductase subunit C